MLSNACLFCNFVFGLCSHLVFRLLGNGYQLNRRYLLEVMPSSDACKSAHEPSSAPLHLLQLPVEIRSSIYDFYFSSLEFQLLSKRNANPSKRSIPLQCRCNHKAEPLAVLGVSRKVRDEALLHFGKSHVVITALFPGWHQASRDTLEIPPVHAERILCLELRFLDSNFSILQALPNLKKAFVYPPGELRCRRWSNDPLNGSSCWSREEIDGGRGWKEMKNELASSMKLMHDLVDAAPSPMAFDVHFSVGFKFLIKPLHWSHSGRLLSTRGNFYSVVRTVLYAKSTHLTMSSTAQQSVISTVGSECRETRSRSCRWSQFKTEHYGGRFTEQACPPLYITTRTCACTPRRSQTAKSVFVPGTPRAITMTRSFLNIVSTLTLSTWGPRPPSFEQTLETRANALAPTDIGGLNLHLGTPILSPTSHIPRHVSFQSLA